MMLGGFSVNSRRISVLKTSEGGQKRGLGARTSGLFFGIILMKCLEFLIKSEGLFMGFWKHVGFQSGAKMDAKIHKGIINFV